jgi:hypothetical protein
MEAGSLPEASLNSSSGSVYQIQLLFHDTPRINGTRNFCSYTRTCQVEPESLINFLDPVKQ